MTKKKDKKNEKTKKQILKELKKGNQTLGQLIKSNDKLRKELDRMKELMNYVSGSSEKK